MYWTTSDGNGALLSPAVTVVIFLHSTVSALVIITGWSLKARPNAMRIVTQYLSIYPSVMISWVNQEGTESLHWYWQEESWLAFSSRVLCGCDILACIEKPSPVFIDWLFWWCSIETTDGTFYNVHQPITLGAHSVGVLVLLDQRWDGMDGKLLTIIELNIKCTLFLLNKNWLLHAL